MNDMSLAVRSVLSKYVTFSGRASRAEFWWWFLAVLLLSLALGAIDGAVIAPLLGFDAFDANAGQPLSLIAGLVLLLPGISVSMRRLHDIGRSGWWLLLVLLPVIGALVLLFFYVQAGDPEANEYGEPSVLGAG